MVTVHGLYLRIIEWYQPVIVFLPSTYPGNGYAPKQEVGYLEEIITADLTSALT